MVKTAARGLVMRGDLGIPADQLDEFQLRALTDQLTRKKKVWAEEDEPETVCCLTTTTDHVWVPRYFDTAMWAGVREWDWTEGEHHPFVLKAALDPERGQPPAVPAMVDHLKQNLGGILIAPTGTGKTLMSYAIAAQFKRKIGVPVYVGHMLDNWIEHAKFALGLTDDDIGIVQEDRCDIGKPVTLMSIQTLLSRGVPEKLKQQIGFLICDEVHRYGAKVWREIIGMFPAKYRLGCSADPVRKDGLDEVVAWSFGKVGHRAQRVRTEVAKAPDVVSIAFDRAYPYEKFCKWSKDLITSEWKSGDPHPSKYDTLLGNDLPRTKMIAGEIVNAANKGRQILVLSSRVDHLAALWLEVVKLLDPIHPVERLAKKIAYPAGHRFIQTAMLGAGLNSDDRKAVSQADVIFATFAMARDALNVPKLDTLFFATPPGDPLQPLGRLREKAEGIDRRPLMVVDCFESDVPFSVNRNTKRSRAYEKLGCKVTMIQRQPKVIQ